MLPGSDRWRQLVIRPGEHPVRELARAVPRDGALEGLGDRRRPGVALAAG